MKIEAVPFGVTDWSTVPETTHPGVSGVATWRTVQAGNVRVRIVTYSPGYLADHWCSRGHILLVLEGELLTEIQGGAVHTLTAGTSLPRSTCLCTMKTILRTSDGSMK